MCAVIYIYKFKMIQLEVQLLLENVKKAKLSFDQEIRFISEEI